MPNELEPAGFQPQLLEYFTTVDLIARVKKLAARVPDGVISKAVIERIAKSKEEADTLYHVAGAFKFLTVQGVKSNEIVGVHIWSGVDPDAFQVEPIQRIGNVTPRLIDASDRKGLVVLFRKNLVDLPFLTEQWLGLPQASRDPNALDFSSLQGEIKEYVDGLRKYAEEPEKDSALLAIQTINKRIVEGEKKFQNGDISVVHFWGYRARASLEGFLGEHGDLRYPSRLRSLTALSTAADMMRAEIIYERLSGTGVIAECFGYAGMGLLQCRAAEKIMGSSGSLIRQRCMVPDIPEIAEISRRIATQIQQQSIFQIF